MQKLDVINEQENERIQKAENIDLIKFDITLLNNIKSCQ